MALARTKKVKQAILDVENLLEQVYPNKAEMDDDEKSVFICG